MRCPAFGSATLKTVALIGAVVACMAGSVVAIATPTVREDVISSVRLERSSGVWRITNSRVTVSPGAEWTTALGGGPMALTIESGKIGIVLGDGSARLERQVEPLVGGFVGALEAETRTELSSGDRLVVDRGAALDITNDHDVAAVAMLLRARYVPPPLQYGVQ